MDEIVRKGRISEWCERDWIDGWIEVGAKVWKGDRVFDLPPLSG